MKKFIRSVKWNLNDMDMGKQFIREEYSDILLEYDNEIPASAGMTGLWMWDAKSIMKQCFYQRLRVEGN